MLHTSLVVCQMDPHYRPNLVERRTLYGLVLEQRRNDAIIDKNLLTASPPVTACTEVGT